MLLDFGERQITADTAPEPGFPADWHRRAACRGGDLSWFYPDSEIADDGEVVDPSTEHRNMVRAKRVCASCPVGVVCLVESIVSNEEFGVWGGAGEGTRRGFRHLLRQSPHPNDAGPAGCTCEFCVEAEAHFDALRSGRLGSGNLLLFGPEANVTHGKPATYARGCRCPECREGLRRSRARLDAERRQRERLAVGE